MGLDIASIVESLENHPEPVFLGRPSVSVYNLGNRVGLKIETSGEIPLKLFIEESGYRLTRNPLQFLLKKPLNPQFSGIDIYLEGTRGFIAVFEDKYESKFAKPLIKDACEYFSMVDKLVAKGVPQDFSDIAVIGYDLIRFGVLSS